MSESNGGAQQTQGKVRLVCVLFAAAFAIALGYWWMDQVPPEPNFSGYYEGPWVNKRGQLVAADGTILRKVYNSTSKSEATIQLP
jgi:hypothetical protein